MQVRILSGVFFFLRRLIINTAQALASDLRDNVKLMEELQDKIDSRDSEIAQLQAQIDKLRSELAALKG